MVLRGGPGGRCRCRRSPTQRPSEVGTMMRKTLLQAVLMACVLAWTTGAGAASPAGAPSGRVAFASDRDWGRIPSSQIYAVNTDGTGLTRLTNFSWWAFQPSWSPDGQSIAFAGIRPENQFRTGHGRSNGAYDIFVMAADGSHVTKLTGGSLQHVAPSWSPDGRTIAFVQKPVFSGQDPYPARIALMNADGSDVREITTSSNFDYRPTWAPDGATLAFERSFADGHDAVMLIGADGSDLRRLVSGSCCMEPAWSPDGSRISVWNSDRQELQTIDVVTRQVTTIAAAAQLGGGPFFDQFTSWSSGGRSLAFAGCCDESTDLYLVAADGSGTIRLPHGSAATGPTWAP